MSGEGMAFLFGAIAGSLMIVMIVIAVMHNNAVAERRRSEDEEYDRMYVDKR